MQEKLPIAKRKLGQAQKAYKLVENKNFNKNENTTHLPIWYYLRLPMFSPSYVSLL